MALEALQISNQGRYPEATALLARAQTLAQRDHDGAGTLAFFYEPVGIANDAAGNLYVTDTYNQVVRQVQP